MVGVLITCALRFLIAHDDMTPNNYLSRATIDFVSSPPSCARVLLASNQ